MPTATKKNLSRKTTLRTLSREVSGLRARVEELEDLRDLKAAEVRNRGKAGVPWSKAKAALGLV
jgi:hypothetical protein